MFRRPLGEPTEAEKAEQLLPYSPFLPFTHNSVLSHARQIAGLRRVISVPTYLESTTVIFGSGLDLFGRRYSPSQPFDILRYSGLLLCFTSCRI